MSQGLQGCLKFTIIFQHNTTSPITRDTDVAGVFSTVSAVFKEVKIQDGTESTVLGP